MSVRRMRTMIGLALLALVAAAVGASLAASGAGAAPQVTVRAAFFSTQATNSYNEAEYRGIQAEAKALHLPSVTLFDGQFNAQKQYSQMQDAIASGKFNAFIVDPASGLALIPVVQQAVAKGIKVVSLLSNISKNVDSMTPAVKGVTFIGTSFTENGDAIGRLIVEGCKNINPCKVAYLAGSLKQTTEEYRLKAALATAKKAPNVQIVSQIEAGFDVAGGQKAMQDVLTAHPDINLIASSANQAITGALTVLKSHGLYGKVKVVSNGASIDQVPLIRSGIVVGAPVYLPFTEGKFGLKYAYDALQGKKVPASVDIAKLSPVGQIANKASLSTPAGKKFKGEIPAT